MHHLITDNMKKKKDYLAQTAFTLRIIMNSYYHVTAFPDNLQAVHKQLSNKKNEQRSIRHSIVDCSIPSHLR